MRFRVLAAVATAFLLSACGLGDLFTPKGDGGPIQPGRAVRGALEADDPKLPSGESADVWTFDAQAGERYVVRLTSSAFDPYLMAQGPGGLSVNNDDAGQNDRNSILDFTVTQAGQVSVTVTSYAAGESGDYRLTVERVNAAEQGRPRPLNLGGNARGELAAGGHQIESGEYAELYTFTGQAGQVVELRMTSSDFDPYIAITGPNGFSDFNDDDPAGGANSRLVTTLPAAGEYTVTATSYSPGQMGRYEIALSQSNAAAAAAFAQGGGASGSSIAVGEEARGTLQQGDNTLQSGEFIDTYRFIGQRGQRVRIDATSSDFDTYLILRPPGGAAQIDNDDGPDGRDARIEEVLPADGEYQIQVTSYQSGETGVYRLRVSQGQESARQANVQGGQRVIAVMVGISDYGGRANNLPNTDADARNLQAELQRQGVLNPSSVLLVNAEATRAGLERAMAQAAQAAGPDDVFLFFYSGHGNQVPTNATTEFDGKAETLVMRDGEVTDVQFAQMVGRIRARLSVIVLDSCFSGGFAREVINRPGVMGIFSSEEDLTSAVADRFQAGGYVSHFLREGLAGRADSNGDGLITAGELSTYMRRQFNTQVTDVEAETSDGQRNYQNLVIDRGGVQVDDPIIRLAARN